MKTIVNTITKHRGESSSSEVIIHEHVDLNSVSEEKKPTHTVFHMSQHGKAVNLSSVGRAIAYGNDIVITLNPLVNVTGELLLTKTAE
jgi:hypothetical protein